MFTQGNIKKLAVGVRSIWEFPQYKSGSSGERNVQPTKSLRCRWNLLFGLLSDGLYVAYVWCDMSPVCSGESCRSWNRALGIKS